MAEQQKPAIQRSTIPIIKKGRDGLTTRYETKVSFKNDTRRSMMGKTSDINFSNNEVVKTEQSEVPSDGALCNYRLDYGALKTEPDERGHQARTGTSFNKNFRLNSTGNLFSKTPREKKTHPRLITLSESHYLKAKNYGNIISDNNRLISDSNRLRSTGFTYRLMTSDGSMSKGEKFNAFV
jgi:hypothetical protein